MSLLTAVAVDCIVPRNTYKTLRFQILDYDTGNAYDLTGHEVILSMDSSRAGDGELVKYGSIFNASGGSVQFEFEPDDTKDLLARAYVADILVRDTTSELYWPGWSGSIAVVPFLKGVEE